jgi:hypothetical protein
LTPKQIGRLTVGRNITLMLILTLSLSIGRFLRESVKKELEPEADE